MSTTSENDSGIGCLVAIALAMITIGGCYLIGAWSLVVAGVVILLLAVL